MSIISTNCIISFNKSLNPTTFLSNLFNISGNFLKKLYFFLKFRNEKTCQICSCEVSKSYTVVLEHIVSYHNNHFLNLVSCIFCSANFNSVDKIIFHLYTIHRISPNNELTTSNPNTLNLRNETMQSLKIFQELRKSYKCSECSQMFFCDEEFRAHMLQKHTIELPKLKCNYCKKQYQMPSHLTRHYEFHEKLIRLSKVLSVIVCGLCYETFNSDDQFIGHIQLVHRNDKKSTGQVFKVLDTTDMIYMCEFCSYSCIKIDHIKNHKRDHFEKCTETTIFRCRECNLTFQSYFE